MSPTLLEQMEESATNHAIPVAALLRKGLVLSRRLRYPPLGEWARHELEGYPADADLPDYRAYRHCQVLGNFSGGFGSSMTNQPLPSANVEETDSRHLFGFELREGVPKYQAMVEEGKGSLSIPWDQNYVVRYQDAFYEAYSLSGAQRMLGRGDLTQVLEGVRTRLLDFSLDIAAENPEAGEARGGSEPVAEETVKAAFALHVWGDNNVVTTAGRDVTQTMTFDERRWQELRETLGGLGVADAELESLRAALERDAGSGLPPGTMGPATTGWYRRLADAVADGSLSLGGDVAAAMVAAEILRFLGLG